MKKAASNPNDNYQWTGSERLKPYFIKQLITLLSVLAPATLALGATSTWNGGSASDSYWSDGLNWGGTAPVTGNALTFSGTVHQTNTNDISGLSIAGITFSSVNWNIQGTNAVTIASGSPTDSQVGTNTIGIPLVLGHSITVAQNNYSDILNLTGVISGSGNFAKSAGSGGVGTVMLSNTNNSFTGSVLAEAGRTVFYSMAPGGTNSSLGAGTTPIQVGYSGSSYQGTLEFDGVNSCATDRGISFINGLTLNANLTNNSPNNSSLVFGGPISVVSGNVADVILLDLGGSSTGTNTFLGQINTAGTINGSTVNIGGPGTWVFNDVDYLTGNLNLGNNAHVALNYTNTASASTILFQNVTIGSGSTLDVSSFDQNGANFVLGEYNGYPQTMTVGRTNGQATDINGSLSLAGNNGALGSVLNIAGTGKAGTLTISSNFVTASGTIEFDINTNTTVGSGVNDLIAVGKNLDLSQGTANLSFSVINGSVVTNTPYTIMTYSGTLVGNSSGLNLLPPGRAYVGTVSTATPGLVTATFAPSGVTNGDPVWLGNDNANWDVTATANWSIGGSGTVFYNGDNVTFNDSASQFNVNLVSPVSPGSITVSNNLNNYTFSSTGSGAISGGSLLKQGTGQLAITTANGYSGGTVVDSGTLLGENNTAFGSGAITIGDTNTGANTATLLCSLGLTVPNAILVSSNGTGIATIGCPLIGGASTMFSGPIVIQRDVTISSATTNNYLEIVDGISGTGNVIFTSPSGGYNSLSGTNAITGNYYIKGAGTLVAGGWTLNPPTNSIFMDASTSLEPQNGQFTCGALNGNGTVSSFFGSSYFINVNIGYAGGSGTFGGNFTNNPGKYYASITKLGSGTETFTGDNSGDTGSTTISNGVLAVNNTTGYGLPIGNITVVGGTLAGNGTIYSTNSVLVSGILSVGNASDTSGAAFTITNLGGLFITNGGALNVDLFSGAGAGDNTANSAAADVLNAECAVTLNNAVLNVGNPKNMNAWAAGDKWKIVNWNSTPANTFTTLNLPSLPGNLAWDTSSLYTAGSIGVISNVGPTEPAKITGVTVSNGNLVITGTNLNGGQNFHYAVLVSTNLALPLTNWTALVTNPFNADGTFNYTNVVNPANGAMFFGTKAVQ